MTHYSSFDLEEHLNSDSILADITEGAAIVSLDGWVERYNANAKVALKQLGEKYHLSEIVTEISRFKSFSGIKKQALSMSGLQVCRLKSINDDNEYLTYFSSLRSRVNNKVVAILLQFDFKVSRYNKVLHRHSIELKEHARLIRKYQSDGIHDPLTGLKNRRYMDEYLVSQCELNNRHQVPATLAIVDIDFFKKVNDTYGHHVGDQVIRAVADELLGRARESDVVCRWGGEEFCLFLNHVDGKAAEKVLNEVRENISRIKIDVGGQSLSITASIGAAPLDSDEKVTALFERADHALYKAKETGRNKVVYYQ